MTSYTHKSASPMNKNLPLFLSGLSFLFIVMGLASVFFLQPTLRNQSQDTRKAASVSNGQVTLGSTFQDVTATTDAHISLLVNTHGVQTDGVQVVFNVITDVTDSMTVDIPVNIGLHAVHQEIEKTSDGFLISIIAVPDLGQTFSPAQETILANLKFKPTKAGTIRLSFDEDNSLSTVHGSNPPKDELKTIPVFDYTTVGVITTSPSPSASPSVSPSPSPSATPNPNDDLFFNSPEMTLHFFTTDGSNQEVAQNNLKLNGYYRLEVNFGVQNTRKSQSPLTRQIKVQYVRNGQAVTTKSYTYGFIANHQNGFADKFVDYIYFQPTNQYILNLDTTNAVRETNETNNSWTFNANAYTGKSCNESCSSNQECGPNLRCYNNQCRLAINVTDSACNTPPDQGLQRKCNEYCADTKECASGFTCFYNRCRKPENPDSISCGALSTTAAQTIAKTCNITCSANKDCGVNLRCYNGTCRLATNVSSMSCSPTTYKTVSNLYQSSGSKGEEIPLPATSPNASASPSSSGAGVTISPTSSARPTSASPSSAGSQIANNITSAANTALNNIGLSLAKIAVLTGIALLVLALIAMFLRKPGDKRPPQGGKGAMAPQTSTMTENKLAERIKELQKQQPAPVVTPAPIQTAPTKPAEAKPASSIHMAPSSLSSAQLPQTPVAKPVSPQPVPQQQPVQQANKPVEIPPFKPVTPVMPSAPAPSSSSMMQKIKDKGLDQNIPVPQNSPQNPQQPPKNA